MAQPTPYERFFSFTAYQAANSSSPLPAPALDMELNRVVLTTDQILANLELIQNDEGKLIGSALVDNSIGFDQLAPDVVTEINGEGDGTPLAFATALETALSTSALFGTKLTTAEIGAALLAYFNTLTASTTGVSTVPGLNGAGTGVVAVDINAHSTQRPTVAFLGDSLSANAGGNRIGNSALRSLLGWWDWALILSRQKLHLPIGWNFGVNGETASQVAARRASVVAVRPGYCFVLAGTNSSAETYAQIITALDAIYADFEATGIWTIAVFIPPFVTFDTPLYKKYQHVNQWIWAQRMVRSRFSVIDLTPAYIDQATGYPANPLQSLDGTHPSIAGAQAPGQIAADFINNLPGLTEPPLFKNRFDGYDATSNPNGNLISTNGLMRGTSGTLNTATGQLADGWTASLAGAGGASAALSKGQWSDGTTYQQVDIGGTVSGTAKAIDISVSASGIVSGDVLEALMDVELAASSVGIAGMQLIYVGSSTPTNFVTGDGGGHFSQELSSAGFRGILRTPQLSLTATPSFNLVYMRIWLKDNAGAVSGTIRFGSVSLRKIN